MAAAAKVFGGAKVFMSRNLVPPEQFDALHDALKLNGARVFLCCDPSRNGPDDYHLIASPDHEKFEDLRLRGCKLIGPRCVSDCVREKRVLPNQGFTCCLAMEGLNILASGFEKDEKAEIAKLVTAMGGVFHTKASSDVSFVIAKDVLAQKYKWALNNLNNKPIVTKSWLHQCWKEHHLVPHESYRVLPFSGLTICVSGIPADERKEVERLVMENGGKYSAELTKRCSHLVSDVPEGDKYKVAKRWGHIYIVTKKWFYESVARRACLIEESYPVLTSSASSMSTLMTVKQHSQGNIVRPSSSSSMSTLKTVEQHSQDKEIRNSQHASSYMEAAMDFETIFSAQDIQVDNSMPNLYPSLFEVSAVSKQGNDLPTDKHKNDYDFSRFVADDSQREDDDLYLSECRIMLVGFEASELRKLVGMVRQGGGSRYMSFNDRMTHVVVGNATEMEIKEVRRLAGYGVIYVVKAAWLEDCNFTKKEIQVLQSHIAHDLLVPKDPVIFNKTSAMSMNGVKLGKASTSQPADDNILERRNTQSEVLLGLKEDIKLKVKNGVSNGMNHVKSATVFNGKLFRFSSSFPDEQRPEIVQWINEGGGEVVADRNKRNAHFTVERHGVIPFLTSFQNKYVTSHWIRSCLEDGCLLDVSSHILYSPLRCQIPLPGFEGCCLSVSRYDTKERGLLRNLCYVLGGKFIEKLNKKATHLLCKFADGDKYEAARRWGTHVVTAEWIYECAMQNKVVDINGFHPKVLTSQDQQAGLYSVSQFPIQSVRMTSGDDAGQNPSQLQGLRNVETVASMVCRTRDDDSYSSGGSKRPRLSESDGIGQLLSCDFTLDNSTNRKSNVEKTYAENTKDVSSAPDVAAAIEDLLEQTSKFLSSNPMLGQRHADLPSDPGPSKHWMSRLEKKDDTPPADAAATGIYDSFSETQTDSQVVGYEEDLSGRQMIIDRVRTRSRKI